MTADLESRVRAANPIPDRDQLDRLFGDDHAHRLLRDSRSGMLAAMANTERSHPTTGPEHNPSARRDWLVAAGVALAVLLVLGVTSLTDGGDDGDVATTLTATTAVTTTEAPTTTPPEVTTALRSTVDAVMASIDAYNAGDIDAWLTRFSDDAKVYRETQATAAGFIGPFLAANSRMEVTEDCVTGESINPGETVVVSRRRRE